MGTSAETEAPGVCERSSCQRRCLKSQTAVALIRTDVPRGEGERLNCETPRFSGLEAGEAAPLQQLWPEEERSHVVRPQCQLAS